jgi:hypothetical protein
LHLFSICCATAENYVPIPPGNFKKCIELYFAYGLDIRNIGVDLFGTGRASPMIDVILNQITKNYAQGKIAEETLLEFFVAFNNSVTSNWYYKDYQYRYSIKSFPSLLKQLNEIRESRLSAIDENTRFPAPINRLVMSYVDDNCWAWLQANNYKDKVEERFYVLQNLFYNCFSFVEQQSREQYVLAVKLEAKIKKFNELGYSLRDKYEKEIDAIFTKKSSNKKGFDDAVQLISNILKQVIPEIKKSCGMYSVSFYKAHSQIAFEEFAHGFEEVLKTLDLCFALKK